MTLFRPIETSAYRPGTVADQAQPTLFWVALTDCVIDTRYQRSITIAGQRAIQRIANGWDWTKYQPILVAAAEHGKFAIVDGQHRATAATGAGLTSLPAMQVPMTLAQQAQAFTAVNRDRIAIDGCALFRAELAAGTDWAVQADQAARAAGCTVATAHPSSLHKKPRVIYAPNTLRKMIAAQEGAVITPGLAAISASAAGDDVYSYSGPVLSVWLPALAVDQRRMRLAHLADLFGDIDFEGLYDESRARGKVTGIAPRTYVRQAVDARLSAAVVGAAA